MATILVIDDDEMFRRLVGKLVENAGHEAIHAADGEAALASIAEQKPDLVVTDLTMPGISGADLIRRLRSSPETSEMPIVIVSASDTAAEVGDVLALGGVSFVAKATEPGALVARLVERLPSAERS